MGSLRARPPAAAAAAAAVAAALALPAADPRPAAPSAAPRSSASWTRMTGMSCECKKRGEGGIRVGIRVGQGKRAGGGLGWRNGWRYFWRLRSIAFKLDLVGCHLRVSLVSHRSLSGSLATEYEEYSSDGMPSQRATRRAQGTPMTSAVRNAADGGSNSSGASGSGSGARV